MKLNNLLQKGISPTFFLPKSEDFFKIILNLKKLDKTMLYIQFKMKTIGRHKGCISFCPHPTRTLTVSKILP